MQPLTRLTGVVERLARNARDYRRLRRSRLAQIPLNVAHAAGRVEAVDLHGDGVLAVSGWTPDLAAFAKGLLLDFGGTRRQATHVFRISRPDRELTQRHSGFLGAVAEFVVEGEGAATVIVEGRAVAQLSVPPILPAPYEGLRTEAAVLGRERIYGSGTPVSHVSREVLQLARTLPAPVLDFGCGGGALVAALRSEGIDAYGIELDEQRIRTALLDEARPHVTLYGGVAPIPVADRSMASVIASEVVEHIPDYAAALADMARVARSTVLITVPDASAIPRCAAHGVVPWHLLEGTHVNFFTQHSLERVLEPFAREIHMSRIGIVRCDTTTFYTSLAARVMLR